MIEICLSFLILTCSKYDTILTFKNILQETHSTCFYGIPAEDINFTCNNLIHFVLTSSVVTYLLSIYFAHIQKWFKGCTNQGQTCLFQIFLIFCMQYHIQSSCIISNRTNFKVSLILYLDRIQGYLQPPIFLFRIKKTRPITSNLNAKYNHSKH